MKRIPHDLSPDFASLEFQDNLYRHYRHYLQETPVFRSNEGIVYLTRYNDCVELLSNKKFCRTAPVGGCNPFDTARREPTPLEDMINHWMVFMDPPRHDVVRKAFSSAFTTRSIAQIESFIRYHAGVLLDALPRQGSVDMLRDFAFPLPVLVIVEILGLPLEDAELFNTWSAQLTRALDLCNEESLRDGAQVALELKRYFTDMLRQRPKALLQALGADAECPLTADELVYGFVFLLFSGHETTKNLIANGILLLAERPECRLRLQEKTEEIDLAVEEMLRFDSPIQKISRWAHEDSLFGDYEVPRGTLITALIGAANRDASMFQAPDIFEMGRRKNRHIAFGSGIHHCLGAMLSRIEGRIAFSELIPRLRRLEPVRHQWRTFSSFRSMDHLSVEVDFTC